MEGNCMFVLQLLCLVGEGFDDFSDDVCGAVINVRAKGDKIAIWTTNYENKEAVTHIGWRYCAWLRLIMYAYRHHVSLSQWLSPPFFRRVYKERLGVPPKVIIGYQSHADTATKSGSTTKNKFVAWRPWRPRRCRQHRFSVLSPM